MEERNTLIKRRDYSRIRVYLDIPDLIALQKKSYADFLQMDLLPEERKNIGLQAAFNSIFPITDPKETAKLIFDSYYIGDWSCRCGKLKGVENSRPRCKACGNLLPPKTPVDSKTICPYCGAKGQAEIPLCSHCGDTVKLRLPHTPEECKDKGYTYSVPLTVRFKLAIYEKVGKEKRIKEIKEGDVYFGELPLMTENGTFIINGTERVIVNQLQRSPGVYFVERKKEKGIISAEIIPDRGERIEIKYDPKGVLYAVISKKKFPVTTLLRAFGLEKDEDIIKAFYTLYEIRIKDKKVWWKLSEALAGKKLGADVVDKDGKLLVPKGKKLDLDLIELLKKKGIEEVVLHESELEDAFSAEAKEGIKRLRCSMAFWVRCCVSLQVQLASIFSTRFCGSCGWQLSGVLATSPSS